MWLERVGWYPGSKKTICLLYKELYHESAIFSLSKVKITKVFEISYPLYQIQAIIGPKKT